MRGPRLRGYLRGIGLWTPAHPSFESWCAAGMPEDFAGTPEQAASARPPAELLHPRLRRRTSVFTRATVTALEAAIQQGGASLDDVRIVLVSSFGEIETTVELLAQLADPQGPVSPTKFHNSVHNTATGYMSIASGNHREATALAGGPHNLEIATLELLAGLAIDGGDAVLIIAEEALPDPFARPDADPTFAIAVHFAAEPAGDRHPSSLDIRIGLDGLAWEPDPAEDLPLEGLPSMIPSSYALLLGAGRLATIEGAPTQVVILGAHGDPSVEMRWILTLVRRS
ncbi:MAG TPA: beta-ketoacyl synthase chain length factor [Enhygromyxa sp.]|nr:beta-ketoacyl synthase chain length factor [Enhygromyxa sp.]